MDFTGGGGGGSGSGGNAEFNLASAAMMQQVLQQQENQGGGGGGGQDQSQQAQEQGPQQSSHPLMSAFGSSPSIMLRRSSSMSGSKRSLLDVEDMGNQSSRSVRMHSASDAFVSGRGSGMANAAFGFEMNPNPANSNMMGRSHTFAVAGASGVGSSGYAADASSQMAAMLSSQGGGGGQGGNAEWDFSKLSGASAEENRFANLIGGGGSSGSGGGAGLVFDPGSAFGGDGAAGSNAANLLSSYQSAPAMGQAGALGGNKRRITKPTGSDFVSLMGLSRPSKRKDDGDGGGGDGGGDDFAAATTTAKKFGFVGGMSSSERRSSYSSRRRRSGIASGEAPELQAVAEDDSGGIAGDAGGATGPNLLAAFAKGGGADFLKMMQEPIVGGSLTPKSEDDSCGAKVRDVDMDGISNGAETASEVERAEANLKQQMDESDEFGAMIDFDIAQAEAAGDIQGPGQGQGQGKGQSDDKPEMNKTAMRPKLQDMKKSDMLSDLEDFDFDEIDEDDLEERGEKTLRKAADESSSGKERHHKSLAALEGLDFDLEPTPLSDEQERTLATRRHSYDHAGVEALSRGSSTVSSGNQMVAGGGSANGHAGQLVGGAAESTSAQQTPAPQTQVVKTAPSVTGALSSSGPMASSTSAASVTSSSATSSTARDVEATRAQLMTVATGGLGGGGTASAGGLGASNPFLTSSQQQQAMLHAAGLAGATAQSAARLQFRPGAVAAAAAGYPHLAAALPRDGNWMADAILHLHRSASDSPDPDGMHPIHLACLYCPNDKRLVGTMLIDNPDSARVKVENPQGMPTVDPTSTDLNKADPGRVLASLTSNALAASRKKALSGDASKLVGSCALHIALRSNGGEKVTYEVVKLLSLSAPDVLTTKDKSGGIPLSIALQNKVGSQIIRYLVEKCRDAAGIADSNGNYPLHFACADVLGKKRYSLSVIRLVFEAHPDAVKEKNKDGKTPLDLATRGMSASAFGGGDGVDAIVNYLQKVGNR